jgi:hypothetical protein
MDAIALSRLALDDSCVDATGVYLALRERRVNTIGAAVALLCHSGRPTPAEFDAVADGLHVYALELEDDGLADALDLEAVLEAIRLESSALVLP